MEHPVVVGGVLRSLRIGGEEGRVTTVANIINAPAGSAHGAPDWRADPDEVTDPCLACDGAGCQCCNGTGNEPQPVAQQHRVEVTYDRLMLSYTARCLCGWVGQEEKSKRSAWGHSAGHEDER